MEKSDDFFQALMQDLNGTLHNLEWGEMVAEVNIMMNAGSVTTAIALTNALYQLIRTPRAMAFYPKSLMQPSSLTRSSLRTIRSSIFRTYEPSWMNLSACSR